MIHAAIQQDVIGAGIIASELAAPAAIAPTDPRALEPVGEILSI